MKFQFVISPPIFCKWAHPSTWQSWRGQYLQARTTSKEILHHPSARYIINRVLWVAIFVSKVVNSPSLISQSAVSQSKHHSRLLLCPILQTLRRSFESEQRHIFANQQRRRIYSAPPFFRREEAAEEENNEPRSPDPSLQLPSSQLKSSNHYCDSILLLKLPIIQA